MGRNYRPKRLAEEVKKIASEIIQRELKDPRLSDAMISIPDVDVTDDAGVATIYISVLPLSGETSEEETEAINKDILQALDSAKGIIRSAVSKKSRIRHTPELRFEIDRSLAYGQHMDAVIEKAMENIDPDGGVK